MRIIRNNFIPFTGFAAINLFGLVWGRKDVVMTDRMLNHEKIHTAQMKEMLYIFFYLWYIIEWLIRLFMKGNAYKNISFEREAYTKENNPNYLLERKSYDWIKYIRSINLKTEL